MLPRNALLPGWQTCHQQTLQQQLNTRPVQAKAPTRPHFKRYKAQLSATNSAVAVAATAAEQLGLQGRTCAVLWDLDNVWPGNLRTSLLPAIQEVQDLLLHMGLDKQASVTCYANTVTARGLGGTLAQQLQQAGVNVQQVQSRQQAADVRLSSDAVAFAKTHTGSGCLVVVTNDTGFAPVLAYCTSLGLTTIVVTSLPSPKYKQGLLPNPQAHPLAAACTAAVPWQRIPASAALQTGNQQSSGAGSIGNAAMRRSPLASYTRLWHKLEYCDNTGAGFLEPWMYTQQVQQG